MDFHGQNRSNATHRSTTDPHARLYKKGVGKEARLCHIGHALGENRHGLIMAVHVSDANGTAECAAALSQRARKKIEEGFGWCKTIGGLARSRHVGRWKIAQQFELAASAYNLVRMRKLLA